MPDVCESTPKRLACLALAITLTIAYAFFLLGFDAAATPRPGIDENAYLMSGRLIAERHTTGFKPTDDYQFVGAMWVRTEDGWYYPKYPFGTSLLAAVPVAIGHTDWAFAISPLCTAMAVLGIFFLARQIVGSFYALLAMIVLATCPTTLQLANQPNSHAPALVFVTWGIYFLLRWWQQGVWWIGALAGLSLGFAVTIRYSEALLLFPFYAFHVMQADQFVGPKLIPLLKVLAFLPFGPLGLAAISRVTWKDWRSYFRAAVPIIAWSIPVGVLVLYNKFTVGHFTGYDNTHESSGFSFATVAGKWDFTIKELYLYGLFFILPLGLAGIIAMFHSNRRVAATLILWFVPGALLYTAYYWGENTPGIAYLRFFLTLLPPLIIAAMFLLRSIESSPQRSIAIPLASGAIVAFTAGIGLYGSLGELERQHRGTINLHYSAQNILAQTRSSHGSGRPMILADAGMFPQLLQYLQFEQDADWYATDIFAPRVGGGFGLAGFFQTLSHDDSDKNSPVALQKERMAYIDSVRKDKTDADFVNDAQQLMSSALASNRKVYAVLSPLEADNFRARYIASPLQMKELTRWTEPCSIHFPNADAPSRLTMPVWQDDQFIPWHPQVRAMYEITQQTSTTKPAQTQLTSAQHNASP